MPAQTISEKILSRRSDRTLLAGDTAVCNIDCILGTDASTPMAIDYFEKMGATRLAHPERVLLALDHYAPPSTPQTRAFHQAVKDFGQRLGAQVLEMGDGISHQVAVETGRALPGTLIVGADSHTVMCGALNAFATGIGSSDLAAAMATGQIWLRVPESIKVNLSGALCPGVSGKDVALALLRSIGGEGAVYRTLEFHGSGISELSMDDRLIVSNMTVEAGAKAGIFPVDPITHTFIDSIGVRDFEPVSADSAASYGEEIDLDLSALQPSVALPHRPDRVTPLAAVVGTPIHMVFLG